MRRLFGFMGVLGCILPRAAGAQTDPVSASGRFALGISVGTSSFSGASQGADGDGNPLTFLPYRPTMWGLTASYGRDRRVALRVRYGQPGLGARGESVSENGEKTSGALLVYDNAFNLMNLTASVSAKVGRLRGGPAIRPSLGIQVEWWSGSGSPVRTIIGGQAGLALEVALTGALVASLEGELGFTPASPFRAEDMPEGFRQRSTWRKTLAGAVYWRFGR